MHSTCGPGGGSRGSGRRLCVQDLGTQTLHPPCLLVPVPAGVSGFRLELRAGAGSLAAASVLGTPPSTHTSCVQGPGFLLSQGFRVCRDSAPRWAFRALAPWLSSWCPRLGGPRQLLPLSRSSPPRPPLGLPRGPRAGQVGCVATNQGRVSRHRLRSRECVCGQVSTCDWLGSRGSFLVSFRFLLVTSWVFPEHL